MPRVNVILGFLGLVIFLSACSAVPKEVRQSDIQALATEIKGLGEAVDPVEAKRAAEIAYTYSLTLREQYNVTTSPIVHNALVNNGLRERGICVHWAEDIEKRLNAENFKTLEVHRAIADGKQVRIDHSTAIISQRGEDFKEGVVLDPWRYSGVLFWAPTLQDTKYFWEPRQEVLERKYRAKLESQSRTAADY